MVIGFCAQDYMYLRNHMRIPFVVYDGFCENLERIFNITIDNYDGGFQVGNFFKKSGHKRALCISDNDICMDKERYDGFCDGFGKENAEFMMIPMTKEKRWKYYLEKKDVFQNVSAVFAVSDYYAADLMHFLRKQGIGVPEEISVAGFDDTPICQMISPALTTVRQDGAKRARTAIQKLQELKEGKETERTIMLPVTLVERESTRKISE